MKSFLLAITAVLILLCSGVPIPEDALRTSVVRLNEITEITSLCAITGRRVTNTYRTGKLSYNVDLTFTVKETICSKNSGKEFDDPSCYFRPKMIAGEGFCKSRVEYFADKVADVDVECDGLKTIDSESDSIESSETSIEDITKSRETSFEEASNVKSKSEESSLEEPSNDESRSKETSLEEITDVQSKSEDTSLEETLNVKTRSVETSLEEPSDVTSYSEEAELQESSNVNSHSTELSYEESSNEYEDSRAEH
ncbi:secreted phosphoprotein 24-like [Amblyraja radiata]|uniref:secreted phosphoprotein 24-like n=1 Tax=Amblyraja radiata TaxID=386614 RepID=UPI0014036C2F|nr:secreted phosphoprotein 24-like [Amblyraja radiata]